MEASTCAALGTIGQSEIRLDPLTLIKDFHVILSGSEDNWIEPEAREGVGTGGRDRSRKTMVNKMTC